MSNLYEDGLEEAFNDLGKSVRAKQSVESLRETISALLKKAYYSARTDVVAERNGVVLSQKHVLPVLNNLTEDALQAFALFLENGVKWPEKREYGDGNGTTAMPSEVLGYNQGVKDSIAAFNKAIEGLKK